MARKAHAPTDESRKQVETMAGLLLPHDDIAAILGISDETLRKHYRAELGVGRAKGNLTISDRLHKKAKDGNIAALVPRSLFQQILAAIAALRPSPPARC